MTTEISETEKVRSTVTHVFIGTEDLGVIDFEKITVFESIELKAKSTLTTKQILNGIGELDGVALQALVWLMRKRKGQIGELRAINFAIGDLRMEDEPDPTTETSGSDAAATSVSSPTSVI